MPQNISSNLTRICKVCGQEFHPTARKQFCCGRDIKKKCVICGSEFDGKCTTSDNKMTCSKKCSAELVKRKRESSAKATLKKCKWCGREFHPTSARQAYCNEKHYQTCVVCGNKFEIHPEIDNTIKTCSKECRYKLAKQNTDNEQMVATIKATMQERYGVDNAMQLSSSKDKIKETNLEKYGTEWYTQTEEYKDKARETCREKYGVDHHLQAQEVIDKRTDTVREKYHSNNIFSSEFGKQRVRERMQELYGVDNPSQYPEFKRKATKNARVSKLEQRICDLFDNYCIPYQHHYIVKQDKFSHEFDFYLPEYKILIDADGLYYHSYLDDPDGVRVRDDYDEVRLKLVPKDHIFEVIVEGNEDKQVKEIVELIEKTSGSLSEHDSILFEWCRSIDFPYPSYSAERMKKDWEHLCSYKFQEYSPSCRLGESIIRYFHKSIYSAHIRDSVSPLEGWYDDELLRKVIRNRLIYKNEVDPSKILAGFNISKICPKVSVFNPVLARYLITRYLMEFETVFDPFSGFSGRLLGAASLNKIYIGQDLNENAVNEANKIIEFLELDPQYYQVTCQDILNSTGEYDCLLTCPPYNTKEVYANETVFKTCDAWIDECLSRFKCKQYVFVVDETIKYAHNVVEELKSQSHFAKVTEKVIVID